MVKAQPGTQRAGLLMWFGVVAAPIAWAAQFIFVYAITEAACHVNGRRWGLPIDAWAIAAMAAAAVVAVSATAVSLRLRRETRSTDDDDAPPAGPVHFFAVVGLATNPLFLAIILMNGFAIVFLPNCVQA